MILVILLFIIIAVLIVVVLLSKSPRNKVYPSDGQSLSVYVSANGGTPREIKMSSSNKKKLKRDILDIREARRERQDKIWAIFDYMIAYYDLVHADNFYDYRSGLNNYNSSLERLREEKPSKINFDIAFRFCQMKYSRGECEQELSENDMSKVRRWKTEKINHLELIKNISISYKDYWDKVLASYKRPSARKNRLNYLNEKLEEFSKWQEILSIEGATDIIQDLRQHYSDMYSAQ